MSASPRDLPAAPPAGALELARLLSFTTRIEPELIRAVRLEVRPYLDVGAEADLWFCDWVGARTPEAIALLPECLPYLRAGLVEALHSEPGLVKVLEIVETHHRSLSPALFLEEQVTWHSLTGNTDVAVRELNRALHALVRQNRSGVAGWFAEAWQRLPAEARSTSTAWSLANASRPHVASLDVGATPPLALTDIASIAGAVGDTRLGVLREGTQLVLGRVQGEHAVAVLVPNTHPRLVEVVTSAGPQTVQVDEGAVVRLVVGLGRVRLRTGSGHVYEIERPLTPAQRSSPSATAALTDLLNADVRAEHAPQLTAVLLDLLDRFRRKGENEPLREAVDLARRLHATGYEPHDFPDLGCATAEAYYLDGLHFGHRRSLDQALSITESLHDATGTEAALRIKIVQGAVLRSLFSHTGDLAQLRAAVDLLAAALGQHVQIGPDFRRLVAELLSAYAVLHEAAPKRSVLRQAVDLVNEAVVMPADEEACALQAARILVAWYEVSGERDVLYRAEHLAQLTQSSRESRNVQAERASVLAQVRLAQFWADGSRDAFDNALMHARSAVSLMPPGNRIHRARLQLALSDMMRLRFILTRDANALSEGIDSARQAVKSLPMSSPWREQALNCLTRCLLESFRRTGWPAELDEAADVLTDRGRSNPDLGFRHSALILKSECHLLSYQVRANADDLRKALDGFEEAWRQTLHASAYPQDEDPVLGYVSALLELHRHGSQPERDSTLDRLDSILRQSQERSRTSEMSSLTPVWLARATVISRMPDAPSPLLRQAAEDAHRAATQAPQPLQRLQARLLWGSLAARVEQNEDVLRSQEMATEELALLLLLDQEHPDMITSWEQLTRESAAAAIDIGRPEQALDLLEQRSMVLAAASSGPSAGLNRLSEGAPDLVAELQWQWSFLHLHVGTGRPVAWRRPSQDQMSHLVAAVRAVPGFADFFALEPVHRMTSAANEGPIVVLNVAARRCDALLMTRQGVSVVRLKIRPSELRNIALDYQQLSLRQPADAWRVLDWLWESTVWPVLRSLGLSKGTMFRRTRPDRAVSDFAWVDEADTEGSLSRIWWCPNGPFTMLPLHAAGHPDRTALDYAVHSYTPSLRALVTARRKERRPRDDSEQRMLIVLADDDLESGRLEVDQIQRLVPSARVLLGSRATAEQILSDIAAHQFFHFTGHAGLRKTAPTLHLRSEGFSGVQLGPDAVPDGALAYLSACETAGDSRGLDGGGWTMAASFQNAGFRHVVAMLGQVDATATLRLATSIYRLMQSPSGQLHPEHAARILHRVLRQARGADPQDLPTYAAAVHIGP